MFVRRIRPFSVLLGKWRREMGERGVGEFSAGKLNKGEKSQLVIFSSSERTESERKDALGASAQLRGCSRSPRCRRSQVRHRSCHRGKWNLGKTQKNNFTNWKTQMEEQLASFCRTGHGLFFNFHLKLELGLSGFERGAPKRKPTAQSP